MRDHLGNTRLTFADLDCDGYIHAVDGDWSAKPVGLGYTEILQENHYYAFGMNMEGPWRQPFAPGVVNGYQYNGKEITEDLGLGWYFYGARMYDPVVGRFTGVDPIADQFAHVSAYNYAENKVPNAIDLWGLQALDHSSRYVRPNDDPFGTLGRESLISYAKNLYNGEGKLVSLTSTQRENSFKNSTENTFAILLYEFATGTGPTETNFTEEHAMTHELKESFPTLLAVNAFYDAFNNDSDKLETLDDGSLFFEYDFQMSPDRTGSMKESVDRHVIGLVGLIAGNADRQIIHRGHINFQIHLPVGSNLLEIVASDKYTAQSAFYRLSPNRDRSDKKGPSLGTTYQTWEFYVPFDLNRIRN